MSWMFRQPVVKDNMMGSQSVLTVRRMFVLLCLVTSKVAQDRVRLYFSCCEIHCFVNLFLSCASKFKDHMFQYQGVSTSISCT